MKKIYIILFLIITTLAWSTEIKLPHIPTEKGVGAISIYVKVTREVNNLPVTNFKVRVHFKKQGIYTFITDSNGELLLVFNKAFRERFLLKVDYDQIDGYKIEHKVWPFESELKPDEIRNPMAFFINKEYKNSTLNDSDLNIKTLPGFNVQYFRDLTRAYSSGLLNRFNLAYQYRSTRSKLIPRAVFKFDDNKDPAMLSVISHQLKVEIPIDAPVDKIDAVVLIPFEDYEIKYLFYQIMVNIKTKTWDIIWLDLNDYKRIFGDRMKVYYLEENKEQAEMIAGIEKKVRGYLDNLFTKECKPIRFLVVPEPLNKKLYYYINSDVDKIITIPFYKYLILKVLGMSQERFAYGIITHAMLQDIFSEVQYFYSGPPRWVFDGLFTYLEWKIHRHVFGKDYKMIKTAVKKLGKDEIIDIRNWKITAMKENQSYMDKGIEEMMFATAASYFWEMQVKKHGIGIISKFVEKLKELDFPTKDHKKPEKILSELCGEDIEAQFKVDYKELKKFLDTFK